MNDEIGLILEITSRADLLYAGRAEIANVRASVDLLQDLKRIDAYEVHWRLSRAQFFLGQEEVEVAKKRRFHQQGSVSGRLATRSAPGRVEGHFWLGVNLALAAAVLPPWRAVVSAIAAKRELRRALAIDPAYHGAGPHRVLAGLVQHLPRVLGGGPTRVRGHFEAAVELDPANSVTRIYYGEFLRGRGENAAALAQFQAVIDAPDDPLWQFEQARDRSLALAFLNPVQAESASRR